MKLDAEGIPPYLQGVIAPMLTPVLPDLSLDLAGAAAMTEWLASRGCVRSIFARSGMGKMYTFTVEEAKALGDAVMRAARGRIHVLLGAAGEWLDRDRGGVPDPDLYLEQAVTLTRYAEEVGADAAVHVIPEAYALGRGGNAAEAIFDYYRTIHNAAAIPLVLYQPGATRPEFRMTPGLLCRLLELPRIAGMKVSTSDDRLFGPLAEEVRGTRFALIAGDETYYLSALQQGGVGVIGEGCSVYPEILEAIRARYRAGDVAGAQQAQADVARALQIKEGLDGGVFWKQFIAAHDVPIGHENRQSSAYYPAEQVRELTERIEAIIGPYRH